VADESERAVLSADTTREIEDMQVALRETDGN
jgi:hypothetical protein